MTPIKPGAGVLLAAGGHVFVPHDVFYGVALGQVLAQLGQGLVLRWLEGIALQPFQFNADGIVVAVAAALPARLTCVPGPVVARHELDHFPCAAYEEVAGDFHAAYGLKVGVGVPVQGVREELLNLRAAVLAGGEADGVEDDEFDHRAGGAGAEVGGG